MCHLLLLIEDFFRDYFVFFQAVCVSPFQKSKIRSWFHRGVPHWVWHSRSYSESIKMSLSLGWVCLSGPGAWVCSVKRSLHLYRQRVNLTPVFTILDMATSLHSQTIEYLGLWGQIKQIDKLQTHFISDIPSTVMYVTLVTGNSSSSESLRDSSESWGTICSLETQKKIQNLFLMRVKLGSGSI